MSRHWLAIVALATVAACTEQARPAKTPLANTFDSAPALAQRVLDRIAARDLAGLRALALTETEFRDHVWPELPASRPERNLPMDYVWGQLKQRSDESLTATLARFGGQRLTLERTSFTGETTTYPSYTVHRGSELVVTDEAGTERTVRVFGSAMVQSGRYKVFSFVVND